MNTIFGIIGVLTIIPLSLYSIGWWKEKLLKCFLELKKIKINFKQ